MVKLASQTSMKAVAYTVLSFFEECVSKGIDVLAMLENVGYEEYHNFWKVRLPVDWYKEVLSNLGFTEDDLLVEVARVRGSHAKDLHYHKIAHAICIVLGPRSGFKEPWGGSVVKDNIGEIAYEDMECYFPQRCNHTFHGGDDTDDLEYST
jgi:hypothetical protein